MIFNTAYFEKDILSVIGIDTDIASRFAHEVAGYFGKMNADISSINCHEMVDALSVLASFKQYFQSEEDWESLVLHTLSSVRKGIYSSRFDSYTLQNGLTGIVFSVQGLYEISPGIGSFLQSLDKLLAANLYSHIGACDENTMMNENTHTFMRGITGPLAYMINFGDDIFNDIIDEMLAILIRRSESKAIDTHIVPGWHFYLSKREGGTDVVQSGNGRINFGVPLGVGGTLSVLSNAYNKGFRRQGLKEAIDRIIDEYLKMAYHANENMYWAINLSYEQYVGLEEINRAPTKMGWCHGCIGILRVLYKTAVITSNKQLEKMCTKELLSFAQMDIADYYIQSLALYHGIMGVAVIMNEMHKDTGFACFREKAHELTGITVRQIAQNGFIANTTGEVYGELAHYDFYKGYS